MMRRLVRNCSSMTDPVAVKSHTMPSSCIRYRLRLDGHSRLSRPRGGPPADHTRRVPDAVKRRLPRCFFVGRRSRPGPSSIFYRSRLALSVFLCSSGNEPRARREHQPAGRASRCSNGKYRRSTHDTHSRVGTDTYQFQYEVSSVLFTTSAVCSVGMLNDPHGSQPLARRRPRCPLAHRLPNSIAPHAPSAPHATACARAPRSHPRCCLVVKFVRKMAFTEYRFGGLSQGHQTNVLPLSKARDTRTFPSCPPCPSYTRRSLY